MKKDLTFILITNLLITRGGRADEKESRQIIPLQQGIHTFKIVYEHRDFDAGIKAMYSPLMNYLAAELRGIKIE